MVNGHLLKVRCTFEKSTVAHNISRRQFLCASLLTVAPPVFGSTQASLFQSISLNPKNKDSQRFMGRVNSRLDYVLIEQDLIKAIELNPHYIGNYDRLTKLYGRFKKYERIYDLLLDARVNLEEIVSNTPSRYKRYRTALRLINERIVLVEFIRKEKAKKLM